jgi:lipopolysaccharide/colanic/teichoic acid biosynthesis glycosyltransferase
MSNRRRTQVAVAHHELPGRTYVPPAVAIAKRALDILVALAGLLLVAPLLPLLALAIKLDSRGPVLFRQLRVGCALPDRTKLFIMLKFRSMRADAEASSGAVWASKRDPRVTRVGWALRKTRMDEIPQLLNVLRGDMSIVGPRPERPVFYRKLEAAIPFFADRTVGLRPGITGLAQVRQGYDTCIDDVRRKVGFDHAYAMRLCSLRSWFGIEMSIMLRTFTVMAMGRGQ